MQLRLVQLDLPEFQGGVARWQPPSHRRWLQRASPPDPHSSEALLQMAFLPVGLKLLAVSRPDLPRRTGFQMQQYVAALQQPGVKKPMAPPNLQVSSAAAGWSIAYRP